MRKNKTGLVVFLLLFPLFVSAQPAVEDQISRVETFVFNGDFERAALLAERLYPDNKTNPRLYSLLRSVYLGLKEYGKLEKLIAEQLVLSPRNRTLRLDQLELFLRQGVRDRAAEAATAYLELTAKDTLSYADVANRYLAAGYAEEAIKIYQTARKTLMRPALFSSHLAETYRSLRRWREALEEYLNWQYAEPANASILPRLTSLMNDLPTDDPDVGPFLDRQLAQKPSPLQYRLKGEWELRRGNYDAALAAFAEADRRGSRDGSLLLELARKTSAVLPEKMPALAAAFEKSHPQSPDLPQLHFLLARAQITLGQFPAARATYQKILVSSPLAEDKIQAHFELAQLMLDYVSRPESALIFLTKGGAETHPALRQPTVVLKARALAALDRFDEAREAFMQISGRTARWGEEIHFLEAEWDFYFLKFDEAEKKYTALLDGFPRGERVNDALRRLALLKSRGKSKESPLSLFAVFLKDLAQFKEVEAATKLSGLEQTAPELAAEAFYNWGSYLLDRKRPSEAESVFVKIKTAYAKTPQAPLALEKLGELAEAARRPEAAKSRYEAVLEQYPDAVNAEMVRGKLRRLLERFPEKNPKGPESKS
ncbi:MAG TPA: tetratricopeptide repeat protein [Verrucomicrobiae bacterium]|nr:tetratricopeptide repeat protein [Verrucomicrobiae bacterium]